MYVAAAPEFAGKLSDIRSQIELHVKEGAVAFRENNAIILLNKRLSAEDDFEKYLRGFLKNIGAAAVKSPEFTDNGDIGKYYEICTGMLEPRSEHSGKMYSFNSLVIDYIMSLTDKDIRRYLVHPALNILTLYDRKNKTEFYRTLQVYLQCERNQVLTAQ